MANKRMIKEITDLRAAAEASADYFFRKLDHDESNVLQFEGLLVCNKDPYSSKKGIKVQVKFPPEYPFKPPVLHFLTTIYHPNVDEKGQVCLPLIMPEAYKPAIRMTQVLEELRKLIEKPEIDHALRADLAEEYSKSQSKFNKQAKEVFEKHGVPL